MNRSRVVVLTLLGCVAAVAAESDPRSAAERPRPGGPGLVREATLERFGSSSGRDAAVVVAWSQRAYEIAFAEDQFFTFKGHRAFAMMHIAMHDALNAVVPVYAPYAYRGRDPAAHPVAAAAQAARDVLVSQYPGRQSELDAELDGWLSRVASGHRLGRGVALGEAAAAAILARREGDGWDFPGSYEFVPVLGAYQTTPPWNGFVLQPGFRHAEPFGLESPDQLRPPEPPALDSREYAAAYDEVKDYGAAASAVRTADQTGYALWWMEFVEGSVNRLARQLVTERHASLWNAARLFALLNMAIFDNYVAVWDAKFAYNHWRPYTAIREAGQDPGPRTMPDPAWEPLRPTPPFPEYVSAHASACGAAFAVLERTFGDGVPFTMETLTAPAGMPTRSFASFRQAAAECADSRVRLGWHFRYSTDRGRQLGRRIAHHIADRHLVFRRDTE